MNDTRQIASDIVHKFSVHDTLIHELTHYFDSKRNKTMLTKNNAPSNDEELSSYFNSAVEYNAWFTVFAQPLLRLLTDVKDAENKQDALEIASWSGITDNFQDTLRTLQNRSKISNMNVFLKNLNERNRKALIKRLYALWKKCIDTINSIKE